MSPPPSGKEGLEKAALKTCSACGGTWFRQADFFQFLREETLGGSWPTWPDLVGQASAMSMGIAVCLCGTPQLPNLGGLRGGRTPNAEISMLLESLGWARQSSDGSAVLWGVRRAMAGRESLDVLAGRVKVLEKLAGRRLAETDPNRRSPRGRHWAPPMREPLSGGEGKLTRDQLVLKLQERGFGFREAWRVVNAILAVMIEELQDGGKVVVENLLGKFKVVRRPAARRLVRFGREVTVNQQAKRVAFQMDPSLRGPLPSVSSTSEEVRLPEAMNPKQLRCERCGSLEFTEAQFRQFLGGFLFRLAGRRPDESDGTSLFGRWCACAGIR